MNALTGLGAVTAAGVGIEPLAALLAAPRSCVRRIDDFDVSDLPCDVAARVPGFDAAQWMDKRDARKVSRATHLLVAAAEQALAHSGVLERHRDRTRIGVYEASALGGMGSSLAAHEGFAQHGYAAADPLAFVRGMLGTGGAMLSRYHGILGPLVAFSCGSVSSAAALGAACLALDAGEIDAAIVAGSEAPVCRPLLALFGRVGLLASVAIDQAPERACRPFDITRAGTAVGEGAAAVVVERTGPDVRALAHPRCVTLTADGESMVAPAKDGAGQARAKGNALARSGVTPADLDWISAHGTGTVLNDESEARAFARVLSESSDRVFVSSTKSMLGHTFGACSIVETVVAVLAMRLGIVPCTVNLRNPDPGCRLRHVMNAPQRASLRSALVTNLSLGGRNSAIVLCADSLRGNP